jgi:hypothetical protein
LLAVFLLAACSSAGPGANSSPHPAATHPATGGAPIGSPSAAGCDSTPWQAAPIKVIRTVGVPPVPVVAGIRTGSHPDCGYDRLTFDITGSMPGYEIRYVPTVTTDPADQPVSLPGRHFLVITLRPAQGHITSGASSLPRGVVSLNYPMLKGYAVVGDFEGVLTVAVGLDAAAAVRVGGLTARLYLDVAH